MGILLERNESGMKGSAIQNQTLSKRNIKIIWVCNHNYNKLKKALEVGGSEFNN